MLALRNLIEHNQLASVYLNPENVFIIYDDILTDVNDDYLLVVIINILRLYDNPAESRVIQTFLHPLDITLQTLRKKLIHLEKKKIIKIERKNINLKGTKSYYILNTKYSIKDIRIKINFDFLKLTKNLYFASVVTLLYEYGQKAPYINVSAEVIKSILKTDVSASLIGIFFRALSSKGLLNKAANDNTSKYFINIDKFNQCSDLTIDYEFYQRKIKNAAPTVTDIPIEEKNDLPIIKDVAVPTVIKKIKRKRPNVPAVLLNEEENTKVWEKAIEYVNGKKNMLTRWHDTQKHGVTDVDVDDYINQAYVIAYEHFKQVHKHPDNSVIKYRLMDFMYKHRHLYRDEGNNTFVNFCDDDISEFMDRINIQTEPAEELELEKKQLLVSNLMEQLDPRSRKVVELYYGFDGITQVYTDITKEVGLRSAGQISKIKNEALEKLKAVAHGTM